MVFMNVSTNLSISIRLYQPHDLDAVIDIFLRAVREIAARDYNQEQIKAWTQIDRNTWALRRSRNSTWIACIDQKPVGFADIGDDGHLDVMYVHSGYQNVGVATMLLRSVEAAAHEQGLSRIFTEASITACPFFEKRGFRIIHSQVVKLHGQELTNFRMEKLL